MNTVNNAEAVSVTSGITRPSWPILLVLVVALGIGAGGCADDYYGGYPGYGPGYYARYPGYAPYPGYGYPGTVSIEVGDRPYYTRGPGYYAGRAYYVWRPGHWVYRHGRRIWVHGHYALRG